VLRHQVVSKFLWHTRIRQLIW